VSKLIAFLCSLGLACSTHNGAHAGTIQLTTLNTVTIRGEVNDESMQTAKLDLLDLVAQRGNSPYTIYIVLDSPGGSVMAGDDFIQFAKTLTNVETITIFAASMAAGIVESLPGKRNVVPNGVLMFHRARGGVEGQMNEGELESRLAFVKTIITAMEQRNADRLGLTLADYKAKVKDELWMYGPQTIEQKAADAEVSVTCTQELIKKQTTTLEQVLFFQIKVAYSACPIIRGPISATPSETGE
jgi:ATP-dependent protease ClpP protease subunit